MHEVLGNFFYKKLKTLIDVQVTPHTRMNLFLYFQKGPKGSTNWSASKKGDITIALFTCTGFEVIGSGEGPTAELVFLALLWC